MSHGGGTHVIIASEDPPTSHDTIAIDFSSSPISTAVPGPRGDYMSPDFARGVPARMNA